MKADFSFYTDDFFLKLKNECLVSPPASLSEQFLQLCLFFERFAFFLFCKLEDRAPGKGQASSSGDITQLLTTRLLCIRPLDAFFIIDCYNAACLTIG